MQLFSLAIAVVLVAAAPVQVARAGESLPEAMRAQLDAAVDQHMRNHNLPGLVIGIWSPTQGTYVAVRGKANLATGEQRDANHPFRIGSITKPAIATAVLQLAEEGKLSPSDKLAKWYPDFPNASAITVDDLLRMRSGIPDSWDAAMLSKYYDDPLMAVTADDMIALAADKKGAFKAADVETVYTNVNYIILEKIVERVSGKPAGALLEEKIFAPLGMTSSFLPAEDKLPGRLHGYSWSATANSYDDKTILNPAPVGGAGAMISTLLDLKNLAKALCTGTLLKPETQKTRLETEAMAGEPDFVRYGQGIAAFGKFCGHNGTIMGFSSEMWYLPEEDAVIVINANRLDEDDKSMSSELFLVTAKILFPDHVDW